MERLQKYMAHAGVSSRRKCEEMILAGEVKVNGETVRELGYKVNPDSDIVEVKGQRIKGREKKVYILLNKPTGILSSAEDDRGRKTVVDIVKDYDVRLYPVGRLDYDTDGLLILTNDGTLTNGLIHPRYKVDKTYLAKVKGEPSNEKLHLLRNGLELEDGMTHPARVDLKKKMKDSSLVEITIHEGRNRQVRRMFEAINHPVIKLTRIKLGFLELGNLKPGQYRELSVKEVESLYDLVGVMRV